MKDQRPVMSAHQTLTPLMETFDSVRSEVVQTTPQVHELSASQLKRLASALNSPSNPVTPLTNQLLDQLRDYTASGGKKRNIFDTEDPSFIVGYLSASYFPTLSLEYLHYQPIAVDSQIRARYQSIARPVSLVRASQGMNDLRVVALFPENWVHSELGLAATPSAAVDQVFYFIDRFTNRYFGTTYSLIKQFCEPGMFQGLLLATPEEIQKACVTWVYLHEHFHHTGLLPIKTALAYKNTRASACLEELRVDLLSIIDLVTYPGYDKKIASVSAEFILAERLLRYATDYEVKNDYDAIGTQVLFGFLVRHGGIRVSKGRLNLTQDWLSCLKQMLDTLCVIESKASHRAPVEGRALFEAFSKDYGGYQPELKKFVTLEFFQNCKNRNSQLNSAQAA